MANHFSMTKVAVTGTNACATYYQDLTKLPSFFHEFDVLAAAETLAYPPVRDEERRDVRAPPQKG
jgi:hypothetical protein